MHRSGRSLVWSFIAVLAAVLLAVPGMTFAGELTWVGCGISKKAFMGAVAKAYEQKTGVKIGLEGGGATRGIEDVAAGRSDMGGSCRHVLMRNEERGVKLVAVGWDALAVITHPSNPVDSLTIQQIQDIFSGKATNWKQVGGPDHKIKVLEREGKISGVGRMVRELLFKNPDYEFTAEATLFKDTGPLESAVEKEPWTIGFTGISSARKRSVKLLAIGGKEPSYEKIADGQYMLYRPLYLAVSHKSSPDVQKFVAFVLSDEGQSIIKEEGTVTLKDGKNLWPLYNKSMKEAGITAGTY
jgi:phosphate transport system substrate-binding protein